MRWSAARLLVVLFAFSSAAEPPQDAPEAPDNLEEMVRWHVRRVYDKCGKNLTKTAETLGAARNTVRKYLGKGIEE